MISSLLIFAAFAAVLTITPGLDTMLVVRTSAVAGRRAGFAAVVGIVLAVSAARFYVGWSRPSELLFSTLLGAMWVLVFAVPLVVLAPWARLRLTRLPLRLGVLGIRLVIASLLVIGLADERSRQQSR